MFLSAIYDESPDVWIEAFPTLPLQEILVEIHQNLILLSLEHLTGHDTTGETRLCARYMEFFENLVEQKMGWCDYIPHINAVGVDAPNTEEEYFVNYEVPIESKVLTKKGMQVLDEFKHIKGV